MDTWAARAQVAINCRFSRSEFSYFYNRFLFIIRHLVGVGYQPWLKEDPESTLIKFNQKDPSSYAKYMDVMNKYFEKVIFNSNSKQPFFIIPQF